MPGKKKLLFVLSIAAVALAVAAPNASATTFCVPNLAACPGSAGVARADLEEAMGANGTDGQPDTVYVAAGTFVEDNDYEPEPGTSDAETFEPKGTDQLFVIGAGIGSTTLTSAGTGNVYVVNLSFASSRKVTMRNLTIELPSSFPDGPGYGAGILLFEEDVLEDVALVSFNQESDGIVSIADGNSIHDVLLRGGGLEGNLSDAILVAGGETLAEDVTIEDASWALVASNFDSHLTARRITELGTRTYGAIVTGGTIAIENSVFELLDGIGLYASASSNPSRIEADHLSVQNIGGPSYPGIEMSKTSGAGAATVEVSNSILRGFASGYKQVAAAGPGIGVATLKVRYSNFQPTGTASGILDKSTGNIDADPLFQADYSLPAGSPSIDAGDPGSGLTADILGATRPVDGNGDGAAVRDQGAFEYQPPAPPKEEGGGGGTEGGGGGATGGGGSAATDKTPPQTTIARGLGNKLPQGKAKFAFRSSEPGSTFVCKLDRRKAKPCASPKRYSGLKPGPHTFKAWAIDAAGNKDTTPAKRRFKVPSA